MANNKLRLEEIVRKIKKNPNFSFEPKFDGTPLIVRNKKNYRRTPDIIHEVYIRSPLPGKDAEETLTALLGAPVRIRKNYSYVLFKYEYTNSSKLPEHVFVYLREVNTLSASY